MVNNLPVAVDTAAPFADCTAWAAGPSSVADAEGLHTVVASEGLAAGLAAAAAVAEADLTAQLPTAVVADRSYSGNGGAVAAAGAGDATGEAS